MDLLVPGSRAGLTFLCIQCIPWIYCHIAQWKMGAACTGQALQEQRVADHEGPELQSTS